MPHRVTSFFRNSSASLETQVSNLKKAARRASSPNGATRRPDRTFSYASSIDDDADEAHQQSPVMTTAGGHVPAAPPAAMDGHGGHEHHRLSFPSLHFGRSAKDTPANPHASLDWKIESPPIVLYGDADASTGALVSGQMFLKVKDDAFRVESFKATLKVHVTQKRPFTAHCNECAHQYTEVKTWTFLQSPPPLAKGDHAYPFSVLLGGHLPATMNGPLVSIAYEFKAEAVPKCGFGNTMKFEKILDVKRSLPTPELPHHSVRIFPPTNIKANVQFPQVIHPVGNNVLSMRLDGVARLNAKADTIEYWRLKKLTWKLEEVAKTIAPACEKHTPRDPKEGDQPPAKKGMQRTDTRVIAEKTMFSGWKSNYGGPNNSSVEMEIEYQPSRNGKLTCDTKSRDGTEVVHQLMVEMVVSQEWAPLQKPGLVTQTGVGRILRMHFATVLTERAGIGISWDNEAPPIYQDVPPSPPAYCEEIGAAAILEHIEPLDGARTSSEGRPSSSLS